jgi:carbamate kinase
MKNTESTILIAIGGNSLIKDKLHTAVEYQYEALSQTCKYIADLIEIDKNVVITHGNGPQVGFILRRSEIAYHLEGVHMTPISLCGADTQGSIGFMIQILLGNELILRKIDKHISAVITRTLVDAGDKAFSEPTKPIGSFLSEEQMKALLKNYPHWKFIEDSGRGFRRVVPSPEPKKILDLPAIKTLLDNDFIIVAGGGGGLPVVMEKGIYKPVEAVLDKDLGSALLANELNISKMLISTAVDYVYLNYRSENQRKIEKISLPAIKKYLEEGHFAKGSMEPKIRAAINFLERGGKFVAITSPEHLVEAYLGKFGTIITK